MKCHLSRFVRLLVVLIACVSTTIVIYLSVSGNWSNTKFPDLFTEKIKVTSKHEIGIPDHLLDLFAVKELNLVVLDTTLIKCLTNDDCMLLMASPSIQIGTFLVDMKLVKKVFNQKLKDKNWSLKVINNYTAVLTASHWTGFEKNVFLSVLQEEYGKHYFRIAGEASLELFERAVDKFETSQLKGFTVPKDLERFQVWWDNSHFVECNRTLAAAFKKGERVITEEHVTNFKKFTNMLLESHQLPMLAFGTLLGWYRNCGIIPYTGDIDVAIKVAQYNQTFTNIHKGMRDYGVRRELAKHEYGLELTVRIPGNSDYASCDLFYLYPHNSTYEWVSTTYSKSRDWKRLKTLLPTIHETCTGDIEGHLFFLPCNYMEQIRASYGTKDWLEPDKTYSYTGSDKLTFQDGNWNKELDDVVLYF